MQEARRGCGFRTVGALYLCGGGVWATCDRLPYEVGACPVCGEGIHFPRSLHQINPVKLFGEHENCRDQPLCADEVAFILGVGEKYYSPQSFFTEAQMMGVSKKIPAIPHNLKLSETWVYLIHKKAINAGKDEEGKPAYKMAIFSAFIPDRVEMPIWKSKATKRKLKELEKRGITPVIFEDGDPDHAPKKGKR